MTKPQILLFEDKPLFGLDIGRSSARVMQIEPHKNKYRVVGYGVTGFDPKAIEDGAIVQPEIIAKAVQDLFRHNLVGDITTHRAAMSVPISRAFTRSLDLPAMSGKELHATVMTEASQFISTGLEDVYLDYTRVGNTDGTSTVFVVAMPKRIVDSYVVLADLLDIEPVILQTSSGASAYLFSSDNQSDLPTLLVDFGSVSADITAYDRGPVVSGTVTCGGEQLTAAIAEALGVTAHEADTIKAKFGLNHSKKQAAITAAIEPILGQLLREIRRTIRYYEEHNAAKKTITQVIIAGGGANMPGLAEYLTSSLRLAVRSFDPTSHIDFGHLQPFQIGERMSYVTAAGLSVIKPNEVFA